MRTEQTLHEAKAEVALLVHKLLSLPLDVETTIVLWWDGDLLKAPACVGIRVAEVSCSNGSGGFSWMAGEPEALGIVAAVERCIIERMSCTCEDETWDDEVRDADWRLSVLLKE